MQSYYYSRTLSVSLYSNLFCVSTCKKQMLHESIESYTSAIVNSPNIVIASKS